MEHEQEINKEWFRFYRVNVQTQCITSRREALVDTTHPALSRSFLPQGTRTGIWNQE